MADERSNERIAPVGLPAGQFDLSKLQKSLETAVSVQDREKHPERIIKAIADTIENPELLLRNEIPSLPEGAELVTQGIVYADGAEPVERMVPAFTPAKGAESGEDAAAMRYETRGAETVATDEPEGAPVVEDEGTTLATQAAERIASETDTTTAKAGGKGK